MVGEDIVLIGEDIELLMHDAGRLERMACWIGENVRLVGVWHDVGLVFGWFRRILGSVRRISC